MYTTEKFPAAKNFPNKAIVVLNNQMKIENFMISANLTVPGSRKLATMQEAPVTSKQLLVRHEIVTRYNLTYQTKKGFLPQTSIRRAQSK